MRNIDVVRFRQRISLSEKSAVYYAVKILRREILHNFRVLIYESLSKK